MLPDLTKGVLAATLLLALPAAADPYRAPRTAGGRPDLEGLWTISSITRLERPAEFPTLIVPPEQAEAFAARRAAAYRKYDADDPPEAGAPPPNADVGESEWREFGASLARIDGAYRAAWIVEPADGRMPYNEAGRQAAARAAERDAHDFSGPDSRPPEERCLTAVHATGGPPLMNAGYNNHYQIVQTPDHVAILVEMNHDARIVRLADRSHAPAAVRPWMGDSVGWWEGETLVVETTNFNPGEWAKMTAGSQILLSPQAKVVERFTRIGPKEIRYAFQVEDPVYYAAPWRGEIPLTAAPGPLLEYACHEGNYSMANILGGARAAPE